MKKWINLQRPKACFGLFVSPARFSLFRMLLVVGMICATPELEFLQHFSFTLFSHIPPSAWLSWLLAQQWCLSCCCFNHLSLLLIPEAWLHLPPQKAPVLFVPFLPSSFLFPGQCPWPPIAHLFLYTLTVLHIIANSHIRPPSAWYVAVQMQMCLSIKHTPDFKSRYD